MLLISLPVVFTVNCLALSQDTDNIVVADGFVVEEAFQGLLNEGTRPVDMAFDANGVPYVLVHNRNNPDRLGPSLLRVTDSGGFGHEALASELLYLSRDHAQTLIPWKGEQLLIGNHSEDGYAAVDLHTSELRQVAFSAPGWFNLHKGLPGGDLLGSSFGELWRVSPTPVGVTHESASEPRQLVLKIGPRNMTGHSYQTSLMLRAVVDQWDGERVAIEESGQFVDVLLPEGRIGKVDPISVDELQREWIPRSTTSLLLYPDVDHWADTTVEFGTLLLVAEPRASRVSLFIQTEQDSRIRLESLRPILQAAAGDAFGPIGIRQGPDGHVWIIDAHNSRVLKLRPDGDTPSSGPRLRLAYRDELLLALRSSNPERRAVAQRLIIDRGVSVESHDREAALLDAAMRCADPYAAACIDTILALRGKPLPPTAPALDEGGPLERLERHLVRLDLIRDEPTGARRLMPLWEKCTSRTRLVLARTLTDHPAASPEERRFAASALELLTPKEQERQPR